MAWPTKTDFIDGDVLSAAQVNNIGTNLNIFNPTSAIANQVWRADGLGSGSYQTLTTAAMTSIANGTCSGTQINLSSIPTTYKDLILEVWGVTFASASTLDVTLNGSTGNYIGAISRSLNGTYGTAGSTYSNVNFTDSASIHTGGNNFCRMFIPNYNNVTNRCQIFVTSAAEYGSVTYGSYQAIYNKRDLTAPINAVRINCSNTMTGGSYRLWGLS